MRMWAASELASVWLPDPRLERRLIDTVEKLSANMGASCTEALGSEAALKGATRLWNNPSVQAERMLEPHARSTAQRAAEYPTVLVAQDTAEINFTNHPAIKDIGYLYPSTRGLLLHSLLAVSPDGLPLGLLRQFMWVRPLRQLKQGKPSRRRAIQEKESQYWLDGLAAAEKAMPRHPHVVVISDSESDIFGLFAAPRAERMDLLVRVCRTSRRVEHPAKYLRKALEKSPVAGHVQVQVPRSKKHDARTAKLSIRWVTLMVRAPKNNHPDRPSVRMTFILAKEIDAPRGVKPIYWILATTMPVTSLEDALRCVQWYAYRWRIERYHYVLKSGCKIEDVQLKTAASIQRAIATYSIAAWRVLWMTYQVRQTPDVPCTCVLEDFEWKALYAFQHQSTEFPSQPPTLQEAVRMIAMLGGFLGRKCDGNPGVKTLWRGLRRLNDISRTWQVLQVSHETHDTAPS